MIEDYRIITFGEGKELGLVLYHPVEITGTPKSLKDLEKIRRVLSALVYVDQTKKTENFRSLFAKGTTQNRKMNQMLDEINLSQIQKDAARKLRDAQKATGLTARFITEIS